MKAKTVKKKLHITIWAVALASTVCFSACTLPETTSQEENVASEETASANYKELQKSDLTLTDSVENSEDGGHAIEADGEEKEVSNTEVTKSGDSEGDEADFYGENATIFAANEATLSLEGIYVYSNGAHANGVFSYGEGTTVNISDSLIETDGNCSGGLMTTGGGTTNATNVTIHTTGNSSAAIRSDRGGGTVTVTNSYATTTGTGSPAIYSTADITVEDSYLSSDGSQGVVVEGSNLVTLNNVDMVANNTEKNSDKSEYYQAVMMYQSQSGDAAEGLSEFSMTGGTLVNKSGDIFFVNNTAANISLSGASITNEDSDGVFLRAAAAGWGQEGSNGGLVTLNASNQEISGDMVVDDISVLNFYLSDASTYEGAINAEGSDGQIYVEIESGSTWKLTGDSCVTSLSCDADAIDLNGYTLYVNGVEYEEGSTSSGEAIEIEVKESQGNPGEAPDGEMPSGEKPEGEAPSGERPDGEAPSGEKPEGEAPSGERPDGEAPSGEKPDGEAPSGEKPSKKN